MITAIKFLQTFCQFKTYLNKIKYFKSSVQNYAQKTVSLQNLKTSLLKLILTCKDEIRKNYNLWTEIINSSEVELKSFKSLQKVFQKSTFFIHYDKDRSFYIDIDILKEWEFNVMTYHVKENIKESLKTLSFSINIKLILFFSKVLILAEFHYWSTELEMIDIIWAVKKLKIMIFSSKYKIIIFINYEINLRIIH